MALFYIFKHFLTPLFIGGMTISALQWLKFLSTLYRDCKCHTTLFSVDVLVYLCLSNYDQS